MTDDPERYLAERQAKETVFGTYGGQIGRINYSNGQYNASNNVFGGLVKTTFKF